MMVSEGLELFVDIVSNHNKNPSIEHYGCMVSLLSRCGDLDEAFRLIGTMPYNPDAQILGSRHSAYRTLEEYLSNQILKLQPDNACNYVATSNTYAAAGRWDEVQKVRQLMKEGGLRKVSGFGWIQIGEQFNVFVAGDKSHPETEKIYTTLALLRMETKGTYITNNKQYKHNTEAQNLQHGGLGTKNTNNQQRPSLKLSPKQRTHKNNQSCCNLRQNHRCNPQNSSHACRSNQIQCPNKATPHKHQQLIPSFTASTTTNPREPAAK
ncbi:hypothetical protein DVH24_029232 [Malus domestica]|uniref:DYW domain-containing protein n=1 Tax=Malus domestica TaxID=3750 RepID=A0A498HZD4_MALDO|nr:hypothetical protein DVH24_029232 [Malus domestica]